MIKCLFCGKPTTQIDIDTQKDIYKCTRCQSKFQILDSVIWFSNLVTTGDDLIGYSEWRVLRMIKEERWLCAAHK